MLQTSGTTPAIRRLQLTFCVLCMALIANLQYGWTLFVEPIHKSHGWTIGAIQVAFSIFIAVETFATPFSGSLNDRFGPKVPVILGGILIALGWGGDSYASTLPQLYATAFVTGLGGAFVWAPCMGIIVKWFPDKRGLATGLTVMGYGAGAVLTVVPIRDVIAGEGYQAAFFWFGLVQGGLLVLLALLLRSPRAGEVAGAASARVLQTTRSYSPRQMLGSPVFWVLYGMFVMVSASGLMATAQIAPIAKDYHVDNVTLLFGASTLSFALIVNNLSNGTARPLFGWVSDRVGREYTMAIAFGLGGIAFALLGMFGHSPWAFVLFAAMIFLTWGEIFSLFPSTCTDTFGTKHATLNLSLLYTAKGVSAFLVPVANLIESQTGSWHMVFVATALMNFIVVALALKLKSLRSSAARALSYA